jgi:DNA polymerase-3 subunit alpha
LLSDNNGFLVFQEDTIKFLTDICGFSGSHADNVRRAIGQKKEEELKKELPQILEGYCNYSKKARNIAENEAKEFIQIISDSSDYQFGYNHSTGYSMVGYNCGMLRYHHPLEFTTAYLNNANNEDDIIAGTELAKLKNISIKPIIFGHSQAEYSCDKTTNSIYKGVASIKFMNEKVATELYNLSKGNKYNNFIELLRDIKEKTSCNSRQLDILIKLNYFKEFGANKQLLNIVKYFDIFYGKKQMKKEKANELGDIIVNIIKNNSRKTEKSYMSLESNTILNEICSNVKSETLPIIEQISFEKEYLGYACSTYNFDKNVVLVLDIDLKYAPKITVYKLKTGNEFIFKMYKKDFNENLLDIGDVIKVDNIKKKNKTRNVNGKWEKIDNEFDLWLSSFYKMEGVM